MKINDLQRSILLLVLGVFFSFGAWADVPTQGDDLQAIFKKGVIRVGVKSHAPPFSEMQDGKVEGFGIAIAQAIASYLEVELETVPLSSAQRIPMLLNHQVDIVVATMTITRSRDKEVDFSIPYFQDGQGLLCRTDSEVQSYQDLKGKKVGAVGGTTSLKNMGQVQPLAEVVPFETPDEAMAALLKGEIDAFTSDMLMLMGLKLNHAEGEKLALRGDRFTVEPYGVAMRPNQSNLRDKVNDAIMALWKSGTWKAMYVKWFGPESPYFHENNFEVKFVY